MSWRLQEKGPFCPSCYQRISKIHQKMPQDPGFRLAAHLHQHPVIKNSTKYKQWSKDKRINRVKTMFRVPWKLHTLPGQSPHLVPLIKGCHKVILRSEEKRRPLIGMQRCRLYTDDQNDWPDRFSAKTCQHFYQKWNFTDCHKREKK